MTTATTKTFRTSDGVRISFTDEGDGPVVVLLHGMLCHGGHWAFQRAPLLDAGFRVVNVDLRFHGRSDRPDFGQTVARMGQDVAELLANEDLSDVTLIGHSMGVSVALAFVSLHGVGRVRAFVAIDQAPRIVNDATWAWGVRHVRWDRLEKQILGEAPWSEFEREPAAPEHVQQMLADVGGIEDFFASSLPLRYDHFVSDWRDVLPRVDVPTWIVTGAHSPSFPLEGMKWVADTLPDARLSVYAESGHCPQWNEYEAFNRDLLEFLRS